MVPPKRPLWINTDETSVLYTFGGQRGNVVRKRRRPEGAPEPVERLRRGEQRAAVTYVAFICTNAAVQQCLPQILLGNKHVFTQRLLRAVGGEAPAGLEIWAEESSWMNTGLLERTLRLLGKKLEEHKADWQPILLLDCAPQHIHWKIANTATRAGIWLCYIPAKLTWLLQPCDTHLFAELKRKLRREYTRMRMGTADGRLDAEGWLRMLFHVIPPAVNTTTWHKAFGDVGVMFEQTQLSSYVRTHAAVSATEEIGPAMPSFAALTRTFPAGTKVPLLQLFRPFLSDAAIRALTPPDEHVAITRSMSRRPLPLPAPDGSLPIGASGAASSASALPRPPPPRPWQMPPPAARETRSVSSRAKASLPRRL